MMRLLGAVISVLLAAMTAEAGAWDVHTNVRLIREIAVDSHHIYSATSGGLYVNDYTSLRQVRVYNSASGIGGHDLNALALEGETVWMGGSAGILSLLDLQSDAVTTYPLELGVSSIEALEVATDTVWVGTDVGLGMFLPGISGGLLKEVYSHFGTLPAEAAVRAIALSDSMIWVVTESGVVRGGRGDPDLHLPTSWSVYADSSLGLGNGRTVAVWRDSVYVGTDSGLVVFTGAGFSSKLASVPVRALAADNDTLWVGTSNGVYFAAGDSVVHLPTQNLQSAPIDAIARRPGKELWVALPGNDLYYHLLGTIWFVQLTLGQPAGGAFNEVALADDRVWVALDGMGANFLDTDGSWRAVTGIAPSTGAPTLGVTAAGTGVHYYGWGQGYHRVSLDADTVVTTRFYALNSALGSIQGSPTFTVVTDVAVDPAGGRWVANRLAANGEVVVYFPPLDTPQVVYGSAQGLADTRVNTLLLTDNLLWIGYDGGGLGVLDFNYTPTVTSDDRYWTFDADTDRLPNDVVVALLRDYAGAVWVGTPGGLAKVDVSVFPFLLLEFANLQPADGSVTALEVDAANNIWVGTVRGLARIPDGQLAADSVWLAGETPLPDNRVNGLTFDASASAMWVATENGLGRLPVLPVEKVEELIVYPNPLVLRFDGDFATFAVPFGSRIDIYTLAGDRVRTIDRVRAVNAGTRWDGRNDAGRIVASGLYVFRVTYADGSTGRGRIGVVRER